LSVANGIRGFKHAADDALLPPDSAWCQFAIGGQARDLGAGAGAAGRAVVRFAGAEDEIPAVIRRIVRWAEQLDVVDDAAVFSGDTVSLKGLPNPPAEVGESLNV